MTCALLVLSAVGAANAATTIPLGTFNFDSNLFGNTLVESDGGTFSATAWLNTVNNDPGNPGYLTGANFDTGLANIRGQPTYTIGYSTPIFNGPGSDFAIVDAGFGVSDIYDIAVSTDGVGFSAFQSIDESTGTDTGVARSFFFGGAGPFDTTLNVIPLDLSIFGIVGGASIVAVRITGSPQADLSRVAGFAVPEPATSLLLTTGLLFAARRSRI